MQKKIVKLGTTEEKNVEKSNKSSKTSNTSKITNKKKTDKARKSNLKNFFARIFDSNPKPKKKKESKEFTGITYKKVLISLLLIVLSGASAAGIRYTLMPALRVKDSLDKIENQIIKLSSELSNRDISNLQRRINGITSQLEDINEEVERFEFLKTTELTSGYYENMIILKNINSKLTDLLDKSIPELEPILISAGYTIDPNEVQIEEVDEQPEDTDNQSIEAFLQQIPELADLYENIEPDIIGLMDEVNKIDPNYIPPINTDIPIAELLQSTERFSADYPKFSQEIKDLLAILPDLLGVDDPASYLIIFQNEKELRPSGGILTAYGNMTIDNGKLPDNIDAKDMWKLNNDLVNWGIHPPIYNENGQLFLMVTNNNRCGGTLTRPQDSGVYPDQFQNIETFRTYYDRASNHWSLGNEYPDYDHVIMLNTILASQIISIIEPVEIEEFDMTITSGNMSRVLTDYFNNEAATSKTNADERKELIKYLAEAATEKFSDLTIADFPNALKTILGEFQARHITLYSKNPEIQAYFDSMSMSGRTPTPEDFDGDYFQHLEGQYCSLKSNFYVKDRVDITVDIDTDGSLKHSVNIEWQNPRVTDHLPNYIIDKSGQYPYVPWSRMLVPNGTEFISSDAYQKSGSYYYFPKQYYDEDLKAYVLEHVIQFRHLRKEGEPVQKKDYYTQYKIPKSHYSYSDYEGYRILLVKHAGKENEKFVITIRKGDLVERTELTLNRDTIVKWDGENFSTEYYDTRLDEFVEMSESLASMFPSKESAEVTTEENVQQ